MREEVKVCQSAHFVTLTYDNEHVPENYNLEKTDLQKFFKRLRKRIPHKIKYYAVGEYGSETQRPHYHIILFNLSLYGEKAIQVVNDTWGLGGIHIGEVNDKSINYVTKYVIQKQSEEYEVPPFAVMSKRPAIGFDYIEKRKKWHKNGSKFYYQQNAEKKRLPRYYREKIFSKMESQIHAVSVETKVSESIEKMMDEYEKSYGNRWKGDFEAKQDFDRKVRATLKNDKLK